MMVSPEMQAAYDRAIVLPIPAAASPIFMELAERLRRAHYFDDVTNIDDLMTSASAVPAEHIADVTTKFAILMADISPGMSPDKVLCADEVQFPTDACWIMAKSILRDLQQLSSAGMSGRASR